jgi:hypothetical protein
MFPACRCCPSASARQMRRDPRCKQRTCRPYREMRSQEPLDRRCIRRDLGFQRPGSSSDAVRQLAGNHRRHECSVRHAIDIDTRLVDAPRRLDAVQYGRDESDIGGACRRRRRFDDHCFARCSAPIGAARRWSGDHGRADDDRRRCGRWCRVFWRCKCRWYGRRHHPCSQGGHDVTRRRGRQGCVRSRAG